MQIAQTVCETVYEWQREPFWVTTDKQRFDVEAIHRYLTRSTWSEGIDRETVETAIKNSLCFGLFTENTQIGFARLVTDWATVGYLCDVYILEEWQKHKLGRWLMECCHAHPIMQRFRRILLVTSTAPWLYEKMGYTPVNVENFVWNIARPDIYKK